MASSRISRRRFLATTAAASAAMVAAPYVRTAHAAGKLSVVFGCGGDRDPGKRVMMGEAAARLADAVFVTDDNPRSEDASAIRAAILKGCPGATEIGDRAKAIETAMRALGAGDVLVVAGKGHETGQIVGSETLHFSDHEAVLAAAEKLGGGK